MDLGADAGVELYDFPTGASIPYSLSGSVFQVAGLTRLCRNKKILTREKPDPTLPGLGEVGARGDQISGRGCRNTEETQHKIPLHSKPSTLNRLGFRGLGLHGIRHSPQVSKVSLCGLIWQA